MLNENKHINYSLTDIERYLQGKMNPAEMHELEKAALQDPFLADTIEGYSASSLKTSRQHLNEIQQLLTGNKEETKIIPFTSSNKRAWGIAASVLAAFIIGAITLMLNKTNNRKESITRSPNQTAINKDSSAIALKDSEKSNNNLLIATVNLKKKNSLTGVKNNVTNTKENTIINQPASLTVTDSLQIMQDLATTEKPIHSIYDKDKGIDNNRMLAPASITSLALQGKVAGLNISRGKANKQNNTIVIRGLNTATDTTKKPLYVIDGIVYEGIPATLKKSEISQIEVSKDASAIAKYGSRATNGVVIISTKSKNKTIQGRILDTKGNPVSYASVSVKNSDIAVTANNSGNFTLQVPDTSVSITVNSIGFTPLAISLNAGKLNKIVLKENPTSLPEVVVVGYGTQKKQAVTGSVSVINPLSIITPDKDTLMPYGGWDNFKDYLLNKIKNNTKENIILHGNLEFEFTLNKEGVPLKVHIRNSPDKRYNRQLIEAIKAGPKWNTGIKNELKQKVVLKF
jgi:TonB-dependent SusC/RagA subfamily outer membrane receptor